MRMVLIALAALAVAAPNAHAADCTISWVGDIDGNWSSGSAPTDTNWSDNTFPDSGDVVCLPAAAAYTVQLDAPATVGRFQIGAGATLRLGGAGVTLTAGGDSTNAGALELQGNDASVRLYDGNSMTAETLVNTGALTSSSGGDPTIMGDVVNQGTMTVSSPSLDYYNAFESRTQKLTNSGSLAVQTGGLLNVSAVLEQATGGTINGPGPVNLENSATLRVSGGQIPVTADVNLAGQGSGIAFVAGSAAAVGFVDASGKFSTQSVTGDVPVGYALTVKPDVHLRASASYTNAGTITLEGAAGQGAAQLETENGNAADAETLTNTGTLTSNAAGSQRLSGDVVNQGNLIVRGPEFGFYESAETRAPTLTNPGTLTVQAGAALKVFSTSRLELTGSGTINGPGAVRTDSTSTLRIGGGSIAANADVDLDGSSGIAFLAGSAGVTGAVDAVALFTTHPISGTVPAGVTLTVGPTVLLRATADWVNAGTIRLGTATGSGTSELQSENGNAADVETLTNTGTITSSPSGQQRIEGNFVNQGTLSVSPLGLSVLPRDESRTPTLTNAAGGTISLGTGGLLNADGAAPIALQGGVLTGSGGISGAVANTGAEIRPGAASPDQIAITGSYQQSGAGTLVADVATAGTTTVADKLAVSGAATLGGRLRIRTSGGRPAVGKTLPVVTTGPGGRTGTFADVEGLLSGAYDVGYGSDRVELKTVAVADVPALTVGDASVTEGNGGTADLKVPVTISPAPAAGVQVTVHYTLADETATAGSDYTAGSGTLTFAPGDTSEDIHVPVTGDTTPEPDETLLVRLDDPVGAPLRDSRATATINGDDVSLTSLTPGHGGDAGTTTITATGAGFGAGSALTITRGAKTLTGADPSASADGTKLSAKFSLAGAERGGWDVAATGRGGATASKPGAFTVEAAAPAETTPTVVTAPPALRAGFLGTLKLTVFNPGNTDQDLCLIRVSGRDVELRRLGKLDFVSPTLEIDGNEPSDTPGEPKIGVVPANGFRTLTVEFRSTTQVAHAPLGILAQVYTCEETLGGTLRPPPVDIEHIDIIDPQVDPIIPHPVPGGSGGATIDNRQANDPNEIDGPAGAGDPRWIRPDGALAYTIKFENKADASAAAALVTVTHVLDDAVDLDAFELGSLGWGDKQVVVPAGRQSYHGEVGLADGDVVYVDAGLDRATRTVTWTLQTIDPDTGQLDADPDAGFLAPEDGSGRGNGRVTYSARLLPAVAQGETIPAQAKIVFDLNAPIDTPVWTNTVDRQAPQSAVSKAVQPSGTECKQQLDLEWAGSDPGAGIRSYAVLVSKNGGPYEKLSAATTATKGVLTTEAGASYAFATVARDSAGNEEAPPAAPDAKATTVDCAAAPAKLSKRPVSAKLGKVNRKGVAKLVVRNREAFAIKARLAVLAAKGKKKAAKGATLKLAAQARRTVKLRFAKRARKRPKKVRLRLAVTGPAGDKRTLTVKAKLRR